MEMRVVMDMDMDTRTHLSLQYSESVDQSSQPALPTVSASPAPERLESLDGPST